jgi:UDP-N-acetylmuramoyl-tripeptide--D-alanyl-D-alanine ligase
VLSAIARQNIGVITMCGPAHLLGFGSLDNVASAKGYMVATLSAGAVAVLNADDRYFDYWCAVSGTPDIRSFGIDAPAACRARELQIRAPGAGLAFVLESPHGSVDIELPFDGRHNIYNALAASAAALAAGATLEDVRLGLREAHRVHGRLEITAGPRASVIINDSYNANPASLAAAISVLGEACGARWMVLGDMGELGPDERSLHRAAGAAARRGGVNRLFTIGVLAAEAALAFGEDAAHFMDLETLAAVLEGELEPDVTLLVKGSRAMQLDLLVARLQQAGEATC